MPLSRFLQNVNESLAENRFIRLSLNHYNGPEKDLKKLVARKIILRGEEALTFVYRYQTRDITKNYPIEQAMEIIADIMQSEWNHAILCASDKDVLFERKGDKAFVRRSAPSLKMETNLQHDKEKVRLVKPQQSSFLTELKLADANGRVYQNAQDKFRQINKFVEIFASLLTDENISRLKHIVDMGSGKGYLTFALYEYLTKRTQQPVRVTGVEFRPDMVELCNGVARRVGFSGLSFVQGTIRDYKATSIDVLIALHACDTATDDSIAAAILAGTEIILCAPCCHKQIRREMEKTKVKNELDFLMQYGTFVERQAEMVTDGLRALILNYFGYKTKVFEFVSDAHTPKNVMITAVKSTVTPEQQQEILAQIKAAKKFYGIGTHYLETLVDLK